MINGRATSRRRHIHGRASTGKRWGRIGDSPLIGAGTYADDRACAVSATGSGEYFIRAAAAAEIGARVRMLGETAQQAADAVVAELKAMGGDGGVIVVGPGGDMGWSFNTPGLFRGAWREPRHVEAGRQAGGHRFRSLFLKY